MRPHAYRGSDDAALSKSWQRYLAEHHISAAVLRGARMRRARYGAMIPVISYGIRSLGA